MTAPNRPYSAPAAHVAWLGGLALAAAMLAAAVGEAAERGRQYHAPFGLNEVIVSEHEDLRRLIRRCWRLPATTQRLDFNVHVRVSFRPDGSVETARVVDYDWITAEPFRFSVARSARRAVTERRCNPLPLPDDVRKKGGRITLTFNPRAIFGR